MTNFFSRRITVEHPLILPIVHLNGTSREELIQVRRQTARRLHEAIEQLCAMSPNGRDYYPVRGLWDQARDQHARRLTTLDEIYNEIMAEALALSDEA
jgi:hypothetical protein